MNCTLIVFVKNPVRGKVKTRVAATVGDDKALEVYLTLVNHTKEVVKEWFLTNETMLTKKVAVYYGDFVNNEDTWQETWIAKKIQPNVADLGERMKTAFEQELNEAGERVVIIGSDCLALRPAHISEAFAALEEHEVVIGPADDGGYYLLGMKQLQVYLFEDKPWSQSSLLTQTLAQLNALSTSVWLGEALSDVDTWEDYLRESERLRSRE